MEDELFDPNPCDSDDEAWEGFLDMEAGGVLPSDAQVLKHLGIPRTRGPKKQRMAPELTPCGIDLTDPLAQDPESGRAKTFRARYRLPWHLLRDLVKRALAENWFGVPVPESADAGEDSWMFRDLGRDVTGERGVPLALKIMAALRMLGRGEPADSAAHSIGCSASTVSTFSKLFHKMIVQKLYAFYVRPPPPGSERERVARIYELLGFPGCMGSIDVVHLEWDRCPVGWTAQVFPLPFTSTPGTLPCQCGHTGLLAGRGASRTPNIGRGASRTPNMRAELLTLRGSCRRAARRGTRR